MTPSRQDTTPSVDKPAADSAAQPKLSPGDAAKLNAMAKRVAAAFGEIVGVLMRAPQYRHAFLSDLEWLVLPALATGQFALAEARHKDSGLAAPVAVILWASVADEVDARLSSNLGAHVGASAAHQQPHVRLKPAEWASGNNAWLVEAVGDQRAVKALINQTLAGPLKTRGLKIVTRGTDGKPALQVLRAREDEQAPAGGLTSTK